MYVYVIAISKYLYDTQTFETYFTTRNGRHGLHGCLHGRLSKLVTAMRNTQAVLKEKAKLVGPME